MSLPEKFIERTKALLGGDEYMALQSAIGGESSVSIRMNRQKWNGEGENMIPVPWCENGYYLEGRYTFTFDPLFHAGCYYVQEASSMFLSRVMRQYVDEASVMLDLCAAPGGKSTLARTLLPNGSLLVSNEVMRNRAQVLAENITKWGNPNVVVTNSDPSEFTPLESVFDVILTDVPCSGEGMFRKDEVAVQEWSEDNVYMCAERQRKILRDIWPCLKSGGLLIYSTCTYNREENEDNVEWICNELGGEVLPVDVDEAWKITGNLVGGDFPVYRFMPHKTKGEGLFMAVVRKTSEDEQATVMRKRAKDKKKQKNAKPVAVPRDMKELLAHKDEFAFVVENSLLSAFPSAYVDFYSQLKDTVHVIHAGITVAELKGKDWQPSHSLAMSTEYVRGSYPEVEVDYTQALAYLRRESVVLPSDVSRGYVLLTYKGVALGFVKNIGNRANNLYPQEWKIRSGYLPADLKIL